MTSKRIWSHTKSLLLMAFSILIPSFSSHSWYCNETFHPNHFWESKRQFQSIISRTNLCVLKSFKLSGEIFNSYTSTNQTEKNKAVSKLDNQVSTKTNRLSKQGFNNFFHKQPPIAWTVPQERAVRWNPDMKW